MIRKITDGYYDVSIRSHIWRREHFQWYWRRKNSQRAVADMRAKFGRKLYPGDVVNDCRGKNSVIKHIDRDGDTVEMEDGFCCSLWNCCSLPEGWDNYE